jgi:hypothetical protein
MARRKRTSYTPVSDVSRNAMKAGGRRGSDMGKDLKDVTRHKPRKRI